MATTEPDLDLSQPVGDEVKTSTCYMCACRCGIKVHLRNGEIRYIEGNRDHPVNKGVLCGKGSAGIMQAYSPARLRAPLLRVGERGKGEFREISWDEALGLATGWLKDIRERDPKKLAFFTGRDQSQSLTGWWAMQYGTPNFAAHGGFCSVNMAAAGLYTFGGSFWEFGEPDWERTRYFMLFGVAEDHASNPIKMALGKLKAKGVKIVGVNPVRTGYNAIADEWIGVKPGTDGLFVAALIHELLKAQKIDLDYLIRYTNAHWLVIQAPGTAEDGLFARDTSGAPLYIDKHTGRPLPVTLFASRGEGRGEGQLQTASVRGAAPHPDPLPIAKSDGERAKRPALHGRFVLPDGRTAVPVFQLIAERYLSETYSSESAEKETGVPAVTIRRIAAELAEAAFEQEITLPIAWTDWTGQRHETMTGRPVSMHAMRGISAHANGFHTCRLIHLLQILLGTIDCPGGFRYKPPYPKPAPPTLKPHGKPGHVKPREPLAGPHLGFPTSPEDLLVNEAGAPLRIDKAFSWDAPFAAHGLMHAVLNNAAAADPYGIDCLFLYMANMSWNSSMNVPAVIDHLTAKDETTGEYRIPKIIYSDAYASEMVAYADLVLPDTTYLERWDCISLLDRPISEPDAAADAIRQPVIEPDRDVRCFQEVLLDLGARLGMKGFVDEAGRPKYPGGYADYMVNHERAPGIGPLSGWRGKDGTAFGRGAPNPRQLDRYIENGCFHVHHLEPSMRFYKHANRDYLRWALSVGYLGSADPIVFQLYCESMQRFRLAAQGHGSPQPPERHRKRIERYFDPLPFWYAPEEVAGNGDAARENAISPSPRISRGEGRGEGQMLARTASAAAPHLDPLPVRTGRGRSSATGEVSLSVPGDDSLPAPDDSPAGSRPPGAKTAGTEFPLHAITQRPMHMYHSWGTHNAWLRQITNENRLYMARSRAALQGIADDAWVWVVSATGRVKCQVKLMEGVNLDTVWTWNAIGKRSGAWALDRAAPEATHGFLLNHLIAELSPAQPDGYRYSNSDPVTGQAAWYDLRVRIEPCSADEARETSPRFEPIGTPPGLVAPAVSRFGEQFLRRRP